MSDVSNKSLVTNIFEDVRAKDVESAIRSCQRLAYNIGDFESYAYFLFELEHGRQEGLRHLMRVLSQFDEDQVKYFYETANARKLKVRSLDDQDASILGQDEDAVYTVGCNQFAAELEAIKARLDALSVPTRLNSVDAASLHKENRDLVLIHIQRRTMIQRFSSRLLSSAFNYAIMIEKLLSLQLSSNSAFQSISSSVFVFFQKNQPAVIDQLELAANAYNSDNPQERAGALTQLRRCLKAVADHVQPPCAETKSLSEDKYLNRLAYFVEQRHASRKAIKPLFEINDLEAFLRSLNERASKGVHAPEVSKFEAEQVFVGALLYLGTIVELARN